MQMLYRFLKDESGATAIEYGLIAALISVVIITAVATLGGSLETTFTTINDCLAARRCLLRRHAPYVDSPLHPHRMGGESARASPLPRAEK